MDRLTEHIGWHDEEHKVKAYAPYNYGTLEEVDRMDITDKLGEYEDLADQGLLLKLPCRVGEDVYLILNDMDIRGIQPYRITKVEIDRDYKCLLFLYHKNYAMAELKWESEIGKTVFFTREEAEAKLKEDFNGTDM